MNFTVSDSIFKQKGKVITIHADFSGFPMQNVRLIVFVITDAVYSYLSVTVALLLVVTTLVLLSCLSFPSLEG
jgi:hypothetical protein